MFVLFFVFFNLRSTFASSCEPVLNNDDKEEPPPSASSASGVIAAQRKEMLKKFDQMFEQPPMTPISASSTSAAGKELQEVSLLSAFCCGCLLALTHFLCE